METSCKNLIQENQEMVRDMTVEDDVTVTSHASSLDILQMPDSIFLCIFTYLPFSSIGAVSQVCTRWNRVSYDELLWRSIFLRHFKLPADTVMSHNAKSWRQEFKRLYYHTPVILSEERKEHKDEVLHVSFSHDGTKFATCSKDGFFKVWQCTDPVQLLFKMDMKTTFSWKFTQFSQFNETDTCLLVSGVYFGRLSTSGEIAVFNLQDGFKMQCRVTNKPYDVFGAWYDNDHLLSGTLYWTGDFNSVSAVWLSKASQEVESEIESVSMVLYRFENINSSSIRLLHVAEVDKDEHASDYAMSKASNSNSSSSIKSSSLDEDQDTVTQCQRSEPAKNKVLRNCLLDKLLSKVIAEDEFDIDNEDDTDDDYVLNDIRASPHDFETCENTDSEVVDDSDMEDKIVDNGGQLEHSKLLNLLEPRASAITIGLDSQSSCSNIQSTLPCKAVKKCDNANKMHFSQVWSNDSDEDAKVTCCAPFLKEETTLASVSMPEYRFNDTNFNNSILVPESDALLTLKPVASSPVLYKEGVGQSIGSMLAHVRGCDLWESQCNNNNREAGRKKSFQFKRSSSFDGQMAQCSKIKTDTALFPGENSSPKPLPSNSSAVWKDFFPLSVPCFDSAQDSYASGASGGTEERFQSNIVSTIPSLACSSAANSLAKSMCTNSIATQTENIPSRSSSFHSLSHHSHSLTPDLCGSAPREKLLIYTWGSETYIPHKIGIKRMRWSDFNKGEVTARRSSMLLPDVMENLHNMAGNRRDKPDVTIEMHGHIVGLSLSPDHKFLYVNCRPWPKDYLISDPQESPPLAQEVEISTIDLSTFNFVGPVLRSHKAYTHSDECFFLNLDVCDHYVVSGAEDRQGYLWDRHYGVPLYRFPHRNVVNCVAINPQDSEQLVTVSDDYTFKVWISRARAKERLTSSNNNSLTAGK